VPDHSVVHRYARCLSYPEWGVGTVSGIYFTGDTRSGENGDTGSGTNGDEDVQQWARVKFAVGVRTVPAGSLQFVDFSKPDAGADRVQRFIQQHQNIITDRIKRWIGDSDKREIRHILRQMQALCTAEHMVVPDSRRTEKLVELTVVATWHVVDGIHRLS